MFADTLALLSESERFVCMAPLLYSARNSGIARLTNTGTDLELIGLGLASSSDGKVLEITLEGVGPPPSLSNTNWRITLDNVCAIEAAIRQQINFGPEVYWTANLEFRPDLPAAAVVSDYVELARQGLSILEKEV